MVDAIKEFWATLTGGHKIAIVLILLILIAAAGFLAVNNTRQYFANRALESKASRAEAVKDEALKQAAAVASEIRRREDELNKKEIIVNEKYKQLDIATRSRVDAELELERVRAEPRTDAVTAESLCVELATLGYPCK